MPGPSVPLSARSAELAITGHDSPYQTPRRRDHGHAARRADRSTAWLAEQRLEAAKTARASRKKPGASPSRAGWVLQVLPEAVEALLGLLHPTESLPRHREEGEVCTGGAGGLRTTANSVPTLAAIPAAASRPRPGSSGPSSRQSTVGLPRRAERWSSSCTVWRGSSRPQIKGTTAAPPADGPLLLPMEAIQSIWRLVRSLDDTRAGNHPRPA